MGIKSFFVLCAFSFLSVSCLKSVSTRVEKGALESSRQESPVLDQRASKITKPLKKKRPELGLILGPGLSNSFVHIGVLKALKSSNVSFRSLVGMGWSSLVVNEFSSEGSVHGLEWRASRSEALSELLQTRFWNKKVQAKSVKDSSLLAKSLLSTQSAGAKSCVLYNKKYNRLTYTDKPGLCMALPPLFESGLTYTPYVFSVKKIAEDLRRSGAEVIVYIDVLGPHVLNWGPGAGGRVSEVSYWYWEFAAESLHQSLSSVDYVLPAYQNRVGLLDFTKTLNLVRHGESKGSDLVEHLQEAYGF